MLTYLLSPRTSLIASRQSWGGPNRRPASIPTFSRSSPSIAIRLSSLSNSLPSTSSIFSGASMNRSTLSSFPRRPMFHFPLLISRSPTVTPDDHSLRSQRLRRDRDGGDGTSRSQHRSLFDTSPR